MPVPTLSFLIANWNGGAMLRECLDSIVSQTTREVLEVIVVDNGSTDGSCDLPHFARPGWRLERAGSNLGFSPANNLAYRLCRGEFIALVNNDVRLMPDWTEKIASSLRAHPEAGSAACRLLQHSQPDRLDSAGFAWHTCAAVTAWQGHPAESFARRDHRPFGAVASAAVYRRDAIRQTGLFRDPFFAYYEDTDLAVRLRLFGWDCVYVDEAVALHRGSATGGRSSAFRDYHLRRNVEYLYWTNMVGSLALRHLPVHAAYELLAFCQKLLHGRGLTFLAAKWTFLRNIRWVLAERRSLRQSLQQSGRWPVARRELAGRLTSTWSVFHEKARVRRGAGESGRPAPGAAVV